MTFSMEVDPSVDTVPVTAALSLLSLLSVLLLLSLPQAARLRVSISVSISAMIFFI